MSISSILREIPQIAKGIVAFAGAAAASEGTIITIAQATHVLPPGWIQFIALGFSGLAGIATVITDLSSGGSYLKRAEEVIGAIDQIIQASKAVVPAPVPTPVTVVPSPPLAPVSNPVQNVVQAVVTDAQNVANTAVAQVASTLSSVATNAIDQILNDFKSKI